MHKALITAAPLCRNVDILYRKQQQLFSLAFTHNPVILSVAPCLSLSYSNYVFIWALIAPCSHYSLINYIVFLQLYSTVIDQDYFKCTL